MFDKERAEEEAEDEAEEATERVQEAQQMVKRGPADRRRRALTDRGGGEGR